VIIIFLISLDFCDVVPCMHFSPSLSASLEVMYGTDLEIMIT